MIRKLAALMVVALSTVIVPWTTQAHAASYGPKVPTHVAIKFVVAKVGHRLKLEFDVTASDGSKQSGSVSYTIARVHVAARTAPVAERATAGTAHVTRGKATATGPVAHVGTYRVTARFTPAHPAKYLPSSNSARKSVSNLQGQHNNNGGGGGGGGGLPNTGGPDVGWLLAGLALAGAGAGTVVYARRRTPSAA